MGDRCSFFHLALIELILIHTVACLFNVSEYQLNQCHVENLTSITHPEAPHYGIICMKCYLGVFINLPECVTSLAN